MALNDNNPAPGEKGSDQAVIKRRDGSTEIVDTNTGKVVEEYNEKGNKVVRVEVSKSSGSGGRGRGNVEVTKVDEQKAIAKQKREVEAKEVKRAREKALREQEEALREGNFSGADGTISKITYDSGENQSKASEKQLREAKAQLVQPYQVLQVNEPTSKFQRFKEDIVYGFKVGSGIVNDPYFTGRVRSGNKAANVAEQTGFLVGAVAPFVAANQAPRIANLATRAEAAVQSTRAAQVVQSTRVGRFATGLATGVGESLAIVEVGKNVGTMNLTAQEKQLLKNPAVREAIQQGRRAEEAAVNEAGVPINVLGKDVNLNPRKLGFELIGTKLSGKVGEQAFQESLQRNLANTGLSGYEQRLAVRAASREKAAADTSELFAFLNIARYSEGFGRREINRIFQEVPVKGNIAVKTGLIVAPSIGTAGFIEGLSQEVTQQKVREQSLDLQKAAAMGGFGAVSAATLGGVIAGGGVVKSRTARAVELGTYVTDPFEKPGDLLQDLTERAVSRARVPVITSQPIFVGDSKQLVRDISPSISAVESLPKNPGVIKGSPQSILTTSFNVPTNIRVPTPTNVFSNIESNIKSPIKNPVPVPISSNINVPIPVPVFTNTNVPANILTSINVPVPVPTNTQTPVPVPVVIPEQGFFPFLPQKPAGGVGGSGYGKRNRKNKKRPTRSIAQSLFEIPDYLVLQQKGSSELTGLFLRDF